MESERQKYLKNVQRVVIKIGSSSLTSPEGGLEEKNMDRFVEEVSRIKKSGYEVLLVTSGAIAAGLKHLGFADKPSQISLLQAAASVGQVLLMEKYSVLFSQKGIHVGQILLTHEDTTSRKQYLNIKNTILKLLELDIIPIINENDSVAVEEIKFGDNDSLAALAAALVEADLFIILSDIDGLYEKDPSIDPDCKRIPIVKDIDENILNICGGIGSTFGSGGMLTKVKAAKISTFSGIPMVIARATEADVLAKIIQAEDTGTFFAPTGKKKLASMKKWIAFGTRAKGEIVIDKGAEEAIVAKGKSILAVGVTQARGEFLKGDTIKVFTADDRVIAKGITNFSIEQVNAIKGKSQKEIARMLGQDNCAEIIHRDLLVVF
jgi:glutamate 5-kinase